MLWWTLKGSVILLLAFAASFLLRRRPAAVRHAVWTVAIAAQLLLPLAPRMAPELAVAVAVPRSVAAVQAWPPPPPAAMPGAAAAPAREAPRSVVPRDWPRLVLFTGTALLLFRLLFGTARILRVGQRAERVTDGAWLSLTSSLCGTLGIARPVTLLRTDALTMPVTWGFLYPVILLPAASGAWPEALRRHVLLHELAHVRRLDALAQLAAQCALALFWFNPLLWLAARQMRAEAEHACDDYVLRNGEAPSRYAQTLVELVQAHTAMRLPAFATLGAGTRSDLETRVRAITSPLRDPSSRRALLAAAVAIAAAIVLPLSAVHPRDVAAKTASAAPRSSACRPLFLNDYSFSETSGTLTANGRTTHYFFLRPEPGRCLEASFSLGARFTGDDRDLVPTPGLQALVHETRGAVDRAVFIDESGGRLQRRYLVGGAEHPWDADAQRWYEDVLPDVIRRSYAGAAPRAERILREDGLESSPKSRAFRASTSAAAISNRCSRS